MCKGYKGYKDGLQPESLADGNWLVKQNQPVSKIETKSDNLCVGLAKILWVQRVWPHVRSLPC